MKTVFSYIETQQDEELETTIPLNSEYSTRGEKLPLLKLIFTNK